MDSMDLNLEMLVKETFELDLNDFSEFAKETATYPQSCGLIYKIEKGISTFCVRSVTAENISETIDQIESGDTSLTRKLRISDDDIADICFFETESFELAEILRDQMTNRRFPYHEELICNVSDPGYSWWMDDIGNGIRIYFSSYGASRSEKLIKLGPIGDRGIANLRFNQAFDQISSLIPLCEFSCSDQAMAITAVNGDDPNFQNFKEIFLTGNMLVDFEPSLNYYFQELAVVRNFWLTLESKINS